MTRVMECRGRKVASLCDGLSSSTQVLVAVMLVERRCAPVVAIDSRFVVTLWWR